MKITLLQRRGLGNQLFQYAAGLYFSQRHGATLAVAPEPEAQAVSFGHPRPFMLSRFRISVPMDRLGFADRLICSEDPRKQLLSRAARSLRGAQVYRQPVSEDRIFMPDLPLEASTRHVYVEGNFQAHQYAAAVESRLRADFQCRESASGANAATLAQIQASDAAVSIHVRRGDYALWNGGPQVLATNYYQRAIAALEAQVERPAYFVFSDDMDYARACLPPRAGMVFVENNGEDAPHEDLRLMAACRHHVIANSTLSWWGAWLNPRPEKLVLAPRGWGITDPQARLPDLLPEAWLQIDGA